MIRLLAAIFATALLLTVISVSVGRQQDPTPLVAFIADREGNPAIYYMAYDGRFTSRYITAPDVLCTLSGGPHQLAVRTVPPVQARFPFCNAAAYHVAVLSGDELRPLPRINENGRGGSLDPHGRAYIDAGNLIDARSGDFIVRDATLDILSHCWSPTDDRVAFIAIEGGRRGLYVADGGAVQELMTFSDDTVTMLCPAWSADGRYVSVLAGTNFWRLDTRGNNSAILRDDVAALQTAVAWSADGRWIALVGEIRRTALYVLDSETGDAWEIDLRIAALSGMMWSNGWLIYDAANNQIHAAYPPNGAQRVLTTEGANIYPTPLVLPDDGLNLGVLLLPVGLLWVLALGLAMTRRW